MLGSDRDKLVYSDRWFINEVAKTKLFNLTNDEKSELIAIVEKSNLHTNHKILIKLLIKKFIV
mgnify:FL=1